MQVGNNTLFIAYSIVLVVCVKYTNVQHNENVPWYVGFTWWSIFIVLMVVLQSYFSGVDLLVVGIICAWEERRTVLMIALLFFFSLLSEATDTLLFGSAFIWYVTLIGLHALLAKILSYRSVLFIVLFSIVASAIHVPLLLVFSLMQHTIVDWSIVSINVVKQAVVMIVVWCMVRVMRSHFYYNYA